MKISLSVSINRSPKVASWVNEKEAEANKWSSKSFSYKAIISRMKFIGGDFVQIPKDGEPLVDLFSKKAKKFLYKVRRVTNTSGSSKRLLLKYSHGNPNRYRICVGYCLVGDQGLSFWTRHFWVFDKQEKLILEFSKLKPRYYFGVILSHEGNSKLLEKSKGNT